MIDGVALLEELEIKTMQQIVILLVFRVRQISNKKKGGIYRSA